MKVERIQPPATRTKPTAAQFGAIRSKLAVLGYTNDQLRDTIGTSLSGRDRGQVMEKLMELLTSELARERRAARVIRRRP